MPIDTVSVMLQKVVSTWSYILQCDYTVGSLYILSLQMDAFKIKIVSIQPRLGFNYCKFFLDLWTPQLKLGYYGLQC